MIKLILFEMCTKDILTSHLIKKNIHLKPKKHMFYVKIKQILLSNVSLFFVAVSLTLLLVITNDSNGRRGDEEGEWQEKKLR